MGELGILAMISDKQNDEEYKCSIALDEIDFE